MTSSEERRFSDVIERVAAVMALPYVWPAPPDAASAAATGRGSCVSKHALLAEQLDAIDVGSHPLFVVGPLVPEILASDPLFADGVGLLEVHECLTVAVPRVGPVRVDVTWDPPLVTRGLPGTLEWDGRSDMALAVGEVGPGWAPDRARLREEKEALRARLYSPADRAARDRVLAAMSERFATWRTASVDTAARATRSSARVILLDEDGRILLFRIADPQTTGPPVWLTPGGGIESGEDLATAAARELKEETGLVIDPAALGPPVAVCRGPWEFRGVPLYSEDWYFTARAPAFDLDVTGWTDLERELHAGWHWWTSEELDATADVVFPAGLAELARQLVDGRVPAQPVELPWT